MEQNPKQVVAERIRSGSSVLVTVSKNPSVDQLASAIGLTLMLNALGKHTTAVFSGKIPSTVEFLRPEETFDSTVDGLRDFIISLDKEKADKLRYKVEDDVVKVFITPYKTKISEKDLEFSQGDYNVDLVIALGVTKRDDLDEAITAHGRILHDATIVTINSGAAIASGVGAVDWSDPNASCLSEMLVSISEALQGGILDAAMSTAFLTGIVSETDRFKNDKTTPKLMTMAAQLMAAGANQQLIATNLQLDGQSSDAKPSSNEVSLRGEKPKDQAPEEPKKEESSHENSEQPEQPPEAPKKEPAIQEGEFDLSEVKDKITDDTKLEQIEKEVNAQHGAPQQPATDPVQDESIHQLEEELAHDSSSTLDAIENKLDSARGTDQPQADEAQKSDAISQVKGRGPIMDDGPAPSFGGTFNATADEAHNSADQERQKGLNTEVFSHRVEPASEAAQMNGAADAGGNVDDARRAVEAAMQAQPYTPDNNPIVSLGAQDLPGEGLDLNQQPLPPAEQYAQPPMPQIQSQPYPPMQQQVFSPMPQQQTPPSPYPNQPLNNPMGTPPPMPQQSPIMPSAPMPPQNPQQMYPTPPPSPYQNNNGGPTPPPMPPGGPPPMPQF